MHVTQINYAYDPSVVEPDALLDRYITLTGWSEALLSAGAACATVVQRFSRDATVERRGVRYVFVREAGGGVPRAWTGAARVNAAACAIGADVLHVNGLTFARQISTLRRLSPEATIVVQDHAGVPPRAFLARAVSRRALRSADAFFFTAIEQAAEWKRARLISETQRVFSVLEGSTAMEPAPQDVPREGRVAGSPAVLWVGRLNDNKDPLTVLGGFERMAGEFPAARLTMVYSAADRLDDVRARIAASAPLNGRVALAGCVAHDALSAFYTAADLFVLGSHHESCGYALLEACACGALPVVTDIPAFRAITAGTIGELWRVGDAVDCARALASAARLDLAVARERVRNYFTRSLSWRAVAEAAVRAYAEARATRRARASA